MNDMLKSNVVVIAGACGRIGRGLCEDALKAGAKLIAADIDKKGVISLKNELVKKGFKAEKILACKMDCTNEASIKEVIKLGCEAFSKIDGFVNTTYPVGRLGISKEYLSSSYEQICDALSVHLGSFVLAAQIFAKYFKQNGNGSIINLSSIMGCFAPKFEVYEGTDMISPLEYSVIKAGINHLGSYLAKLLFNTGVRVNTLAVGGIKDGQDASFLSAYRGLCASKGMLDASDVSCVGIFLLSKMSACITGQIIVVDDGWGL